MRKLGRLRSGRPGRDRARRDEVGRGQVGAAAHDLVGTRPDGSPVEVAMAGRRSVLLFLTSSCYGCRVLWEDLAARGDGSAAGWPGPVVVVTPSATTESARAVAALAPQGPAVVMSSDAWHDYGVRKAPWCVVVAGGVVVADGPAPESWSDLAAGAWSASQSSR